MNLISRHEIDAPVSEVYAAVTDFGHFEELLEARGVDVARKEGPPPPEPGATWALGADLKGRRYEFVAELVSIEPGDGFALEAHSSGLICLAVVDLVTLAEDRTRLIVSVDVRATSLTSKILLQSLKLAQGSISERFERRVAEYARNLPNRIA